MAMKSRLVKLSCFQAVCDLFRNPKLPTNVQPSWPQPWNVYQESDLRQGVNPAWPWLYLVDHHTKDLQLKTPTCVIDFSAPSRSFALGLGEDTYPKAITINMHCLGRFRSESEDLASYIAENLRAINIYDYNNPLSLEMFPFPGSTPVLDTRLPILPPSDVYNQLGICPPSYYPVLGAMIADPFISQGSLAATKQQKFQGMLTQAEILQMRFVSSL